MNPTEIAQMTGNAVQNFNPDDPAKVTALKAWAEANKTTNIMATRLDAMWDALEAGEDAGVDQFIAGGNPDDSSGSNSVNMTGAVSARATLVGATEGLDGAPTQGIDIRANPNARPGTRGTSFSTPHVVGLVVTAGQGNQVGPDVLPRLNNNIKNDLINDTTLNSPDLTAQERVNVLTPGNTVDPDPIVDPDPQPDPIRGDLRRDKEEWARLNPYTPPVWTPPEGYLSWINGNSRENRSREQNERQTFGVGTTSGSNTLVGPQTGARKETLGLEGLKLAG
jgi:hypothetical protein